MGEAGADQAADEAWLAEEGMPLIQVTTFQNIAPLNATKMTAGVITVASIRPRRSFRPPCAERGRRG